MSYGQGTTNFQDVVRFCDKFKVPTFKGWNNIPPDVLVYRAKFLREELKEFEQAVIDGDDTVMFDSLLDLVYVALGTAHVLGYPWQAGWDIVQQANMQKKMSTSSDESTRGYLFDVVKPEGWEAPDEKIKRLLEDIGIKINGNRPIDKQLWDSRIPGEEFTLP